MTASRNASSASAAGTWTEGRFIRFIPPTKLVILGWLIIGFTVCLPQLDELYSYIMLYIYITADDLASIQLHVPFGVLAPELR